MIYILIYITGFILTLTFLKLYAKKMGFDYDPPHFNEHDDWQSNAQAYTAFSLIWFIIMPMLIVVGIIQLLYKFTQWFLKYPNV